MRLAADMAKLHREQRTLTELQTRNGRQIRDRITAAFAAGENWRDIAEAAGLSRARIYQLRNNIQ